MADDSSNAARQKAHRDRVQRRLAHADQLEAGHHAIITKLASYARNGPLSTALREISEQALIPPDEDA